MPITTIYVTDPFMCLASFLLGFAMCWAVLFFIALNNTRNRRNKTRKHKRR